jgi:hypothetical protein
VRAYARRTGLPPRWLPDYRGTAVSWQNRTFGGAGSHADGRVFCFNAVIDGRFGLRACIVKFRTEADLERVRDVAVELAAEAGRW